MTAAGDPLTGDPLAAPAALVPLVVGEELTAGAPAPGTDVAAGLEAEAA